MLEDLKAIGKYFSCQLLFDIRKSMPTRENRSTGRVNYLSANLSTVNLTWTDMRWNPCLHGEVDGRQPEPRPFLYSISVASSQKPLSNIKTVI